MVLFDGCMIVHLLFSHVLGNVTGFVYKCIGFIWWMHDCPPVVLVLFDGCMIVHLLFSHVFGNVTGFVYVWKLSWCMLVLVHRLVLMALFSFFPDNSTKLTFSLWATQNDLMYWFCMVYFTETFNLSHKKKKKKKKKNLLLCSIKICLHVFLWLQTWSHFTCSCTYLVFNLS